MTEILAIWGAVLSTIVAVWNIYKDLIKRDRVKVTAGFRVVIPPKKDVFAFYVTNLSSHKIKITHCGGYPERFYRWRLARRVLGGPKSGYLFSFQPYQGPSLPAAIEAWDNTMFVYTIDLDTFPEIEDLMVTTADGRNWFCPRQDIREIKRNEIYKAIQAKRVTGR